MPPWAGYLVFQKIQLICIQDSWSDTPHEITRKPEISKSHGGHVTVLIISHHFASSRSGLSSNIPMNFWNLEFGRGLVKISTGLLSVIIDGEFFIFHYFMYVVITNVDGFVHWWCLLSLDSAMAPWLSQSTSMGFSGFLRISEMNDLSHIPSFAQCTSIMYFASMLNIAITY